MGAGAYRVVVPAGRFVWVNPTNGHRMHHHAGEVLTDLPQPVIDRGLTIGALTPAGDPGGMTRRQLAEALEARGLPTNGTKADLIDRLTGTTTPPESVREKGATGGDTTPEAEGDAAAGSGGQAPDA